MHSTITYHATSRSRSRVLGLVELRSMPLFPIPTETMWTSYSSLRSRRATIWIDLLEIGGIAGRAGGGGLAARRAARPPFRRPGRSLRCRRASGGGQGWLVWCSTRVGQAAGVMVGTVRQRAVPRKARPQEGPGEHPAADVEWARKTSKEGAGRGRRRGWRSIDRSPSRLRRG